jgi:hypothetical protein
LSPWAELVFTAVVGALIIDLVLFGFTVRALGIGSSLADPAPGERVLYARRASVHRGPLLWGWNWLGRLRITDRRVTLTAGLWSRVAVLDVALERFTEVRAARWFLHPAVRLRYRDGAAEHALLVVDFRLGRRARDEILDAFRSAGVRVA